MVQPSAYVSATGKNTFEHLPSITSKSIKKHIKSQAVIKIAAKPPQQISIATPPSNSTTFMNRDTLHKVID